MKILVCGSRDWSDSKQVRRALLACEDKYKDFIVIHGNCRGADKLAGDYAANHMEMLTIAVPAKFKGQGRGSRSHPQHQNARRWQARLRYRLP